MAYHGISGMYGVAKAAAAAAAWRASAYSGSNVARRQRRKSVA